MGGLLMFARINSLHSAEITDQAWEDGGGAHEAQPSSPSSPLGEMTSSPGRNQNPPTNRATSGSTFSALKHRLIYKVAERGNKQTVSIC